MLVSSPANLELCESQRGAETIPDLQALDILFPPLIDIHRDFFVRTILNQDVQAFLD